VIFIEDPVLRMAREMADNPLSRLTREMVDNPLSRLTREMADSPLSRMAREMADNPISRLTREMADSPLSRMAREMADNPLSRLTREMADNPFLRITREMVDSPLLRMAQEFSADRLFTNERLELGGILSGASRSAVAGSLIANQIAAAARAAGSLEALIGESFVLDAVAVTDPVAEGRETEWADALSIFLNKISSTIRKYLSAAHSGAELAGLIQVIMLILTTASVYYAQQSASTEDIKELGKTIESRTEDFKTKTEEIHRQFNELLADVQQIIEAKHQELPPRRLYVATRRIVVKAEQKMRSENIGEVDVGDKVSIIKVNKKWIQFDFFDYTTGKASEGWAVKKYFKRLH
jgi:putative lumazine-binding protein